MENSNRLAFQIPETTYSPSPPSEPPDIGNWFASYAYESPALNTSDFFRDSVSGKSEEFVVQESFKEDERKVDNYSRKTRNKDDRELGFVNEEVLNSNVLANKPKKWSLRQVLDSSYTPSQVSEPPDIGNWYSSYVYESFVLDSNDDVKESVSQESECEKEGFVMGEKEKEQEDMAALRKTRSCNEMGIAQEICSNGFAKNKVSFGDAEQHDKDNKSLSKISNSPDSHSDFTEPPDIKNWFSSYVYESPVLDTSHQIGDSLYLERESEQNMFVVEESDGEKEEKLVIIRKVKSRNEEVDNQKVHSDGVQHNSTFEVNERDNESISKGVDRIGGKEKPSSENNFLSVKVFEENLEVIKLQSSGTSPCKQFEQSSFNGEGSRPKRVKEFSQETCSMSQNVNKCSSSNRKKSPARLRQRTDIKEESLEANVREEDVSIRSPTSNSKRASLRKQTHGRNDKENEQEQIKENGFIATRKNGCTTRESEFFFRRPQGVLFECPRNKGTVSHGEKDDVKRKVLEETTNFERTDAREATGKWRCPQKTKPNRGPPLKQLRLERWIHRV